MIIKPEIKDNVMRNCHPAGIEARIEQEIRLTHKMPDFSGCKKALIVGASSGYGLASRIVLAFNGSADTIGVSFERPPTENKTGSAGWYNNIYLREAAEKKGLTAANFIGDAFSDDMRKNIIKYIKEEFGGKIDLLIYSVASGVRTAPDGNTYHSTLGVRNNAFSGPGFNVEKQSLTEQNLDPVTEQQLHDTVKVMGGEDWQIWVDCLQSAGVLAGGFKTVAFSYIGPESTYPLYRDGSLGAAKQHLHQTSNLINNGLKSLHGHAWVAVCKAVVTKASAYIPVFPLYISLLYKVMKKKGIHECCLQQMSRLMTEKLYPPGNQNETDTDGERLIRLDDLELRADVQSEVEALRKQINKDNFKSVSDFSGYLQEFYALNGFGIEGVDYEKDIDLNALKSLKP